MSNSNLAAQRVSDLINDAERAMDLAMAKASILVAELPQLQTQAGLNAGWAQPAVVSICSALTDMTTARGSLIDAHRALSVIKRRRGLITLESPNGDKNDDGPMHPKVIGESQVIPLRA